MRSAPVRFSAVFTFCLSIVCLSPHALPADKQEIWIEVRSPHFTVFTNGNERQARTIAEKFEQIRAVFKSVFTRARVDSGKPTLIFAAKDEKTMKVLLPGYFEKKDAKRLSGLFIAGPEKSYVALRLDYEGENPFHIVYHEYVHSLTRLNLERLPLWADEGLAEFYANSSVGNKEVILGKPSEDALLVLNQNKLVPLDVLFKVDHSSPLYNTQSKATIFYAESWALVHYLQMDPEMRKANAFSKYLDAVMRGADEIEQAIQVFGNLNQLEKKLEAYTRRNSYFASKAPAPKDMEPPAMETRSLSPSEAAARRGDFFLYTNRPLEARAQLDEAIRLDPNQPLAHESYGVLYFRNHDRVAAAKSFSRAVELDSRSFLAHYYHALMSVQAAPGEAAIDTMEGVEVHLLRAIELQPDFAPAYSSLASFYTAQDKKLEDALALARKASELEPAILVHYINTANVLLKLDRVSEALTLGQRVRNSAKSPQDTMIADSFMNSARIYQQYLVEKKRREDELRAYEEGLTKRRLEQAEQEKREAEEESKCAVNPPVEPAAKSKGSRRVSPGKAKAVPSPASSAGPVGSTVTAEGKISSSTCTGPVLNLSVDFGGVAIQLRAPRYTDVEYLTTTWTPPADFNPCIHLRGHFAEVKYRSVEGKGYAGEVLSVEVKK